MDEPPEVVGPQAFEIVEESRQYVLGAGDQFYGVWDRRLPDEPVQSFQGTDEGFDQAQDLFDELTRLEREERDPFRPWIRIASLVAIALWILTGLAFSLLYFASDAGFLQNVGRGITQSVQLLDAIAFRTWVGGTAALLVFALYRSGRWSAPRGEVLRAPFARWTVIMMAVGATAWIAGGAYIAFKGDFRFAFGPGGVPPSQRAMAVVEATGFRLFVSAIVALAIQWVLRSSSESAPVDTASRA